MFRSRPFAFIGTILLIPVLGLGLFIFAFWYLKVRTTKLIVPSSGITHEYGFYNKDSTDLAIEDIRAVKTPLPFIERIFGTGRLAIFSAGDRPEIAIIGLRKPLEIRAGINQLREIANAKPDD